MWHWLRRWYWFKRRGYIFTAIHQEDYIAERPYLVRLTHRGVAKYPPCHQNLLAADSMHKAQSLANLLNRIDAMVLSEGTTRPIPHAPVSIRCLDISTADKKKAAIAYRDGYKCVYCDRGGVDLWTSMVIDHFIPKSEGGSDDISNLYLACGACNNYKLATVYPTLEAARQALAIMRENDRLAYFKLIAQWEADQRRAA